MFFGDAEGKTQIEKDSWIIAALGHTMTHTEAKAATCTETGNVEYWTCGTCKKHFRDEAGTTEIAEADLVVSALGHDLKATAAKAAACTEAGNNAYWTCSRCGLYFGDAEGSTQITEGSWVIPATGHTPKEAAKENETAATCTEAGSYDLVVYCDVCGEELSRETTTVDALGHDWSDWSVWKAAEDGTQHEHTRTCSRCGETETEKADHTWQEDSTITTTFQDGKWTGSRKRTCTACLAEETLDALITPLFVDLYSDGDEGGMTGSNVLVRDDKFLLDTATVRDFMEDHGLGAFYSEDGKLTWEEEHPEEQIEGTFTLVNETDGNINFTEYLNAGNTELTIQIHFKPDTEYSSRYAEANLTLTLKLQKPPTITITWICRKDENDEGTVVQVNEKLKNGITIDELQKPDASKLTFYGCEYKWKRLSEYGEFDLEGMPFYVDYETLPEVTYYTLVTVWTKDHTYGNPGGWELSEDKTKAVRKKTCTTCGHKEIAEEVSVQKVNICLEINDDGTPKLETYNGQSYVALDITEIQSMASDPDSGFTTLGEGEEILLSDIFPYVGAYVYSGEDDRRICDDCIACKVTFKDEADKSKKVAELQNETVVTIQVDIIPNPELDPNDSDYAEKSTRYLKYKGGDYPLALLYLTAVVPGF